MHAQYSTFQVRFHEQSMMTLVAFLPFPPTIAVSHTRRRTLMIKPPPPYPHIHTQEPNVFMAAAFDLGDKEGGIHPRDKQVYTILHNVISYNVI